MGLDDGLRLGSDPRLCRGSGLRIGSGTGLSLGNGTGFFDFTRGFGMGFGGLYCVGFRGSGNLIVSNFDLFPPRENFTFLLGTGWSNNVFLNDLFINLLMRFSIALYIPYRFFF